MTLHKGGCKEIHVQLNIFLKSTQYKLTITIGSAVLIAKCSDFLKKSDPVDLVAYDERLQIDWLVKLSSNQNLNQVTSKSAL